MNALIDAAVGRTRTTLLLMFMVLFAGISALRSIRLVMQGGEVVRNDLGGR